MILNDMLINAELIDIITELQIEVERHKFPYLSKIMELTDNVQVCCPYHANGMEKRPSAGIRKSDGKFHCFTCGEVHELWEVISYCLGYSNDILGRHGWNWILKNFVTISVQERKPIPLQIVRRQTVNKQSYVSEDELLTYRGIIHPYMYKRKLTDDIIHIFDVGYDKETDCITFPNRDKQGNCLFVARRSVKTKYFNYPKDVEKEVYGIYELYSLPQFPKVVYICESMIDCLTLWTIGKYACALNGLGTELQFKQLNEMPCRKFILATDSDSAGMKARVRLKNNIHNKLVTEVIIPNNKKDINECNKDELKILEEFF